jgi:hypothetical protein
MPQLIMTKPATSSPKAAQSSCLLPRTMATIETSSDTSRMIQESRTGFTWL